MKWNKMFDIGFIIAYHRFHYLDNVRGMNLIFCGYKSLLI